MDITAAYPPKDRTNPPPTGSTKEEDHPFTPTLRQDDKVLEFMIKKHPAREGFTNKLHSLDVGAKLLLT